MSWTKEQKLKNGVWTVIALGLLAYLGYNINKCIYAYQNKMYHSYPEIVSEIELPGIVICAQTETGDVMEFRLSGMCNPQSCYPGYYSPSPLLNYTNQNLTMTQFSNGNGSRQCVIIPPQDLYIRSFADTVTIMFSIIPGNSSDLSAYSFVLLGLFNEGDAVEHTPLYPLASDYLNSLFLRQVIKLSYDGVSRTSNELINFPTPPVASDYATLQHIGVIQIRVQSFSIEHQDEYVTFTFLDLIAAFGGVLTIARLLETLIVGKGDYNPYGMIHKWCLSDTSGSMQDGNLLPVKTVDSELYNERTDHSWFRSKDDR